jgi:hypothetical protein
VSLQAEATATRADTGDPTAVVRRLIDEVMNGGRLEVIDELYTPQIARGARGGSNRFAAASPTWRWRALS